MARDYKHRAQKPSKINRQQSLPWWKWLLSIALVAIFATFLVFLKSSDSENKAVGLGIPDKKANSPKKASQASPVIEKPETKTGPKFDFYTILPETEVVVPDHEIKTRTREERVGKAKSSKYTIQAGSFRDYKEADKLKARLAFMGIESRIEKARVGNTTWNRIRIGPITSLTQVNKIRSQLKQNQIDVVVTEVSG